VVRWGRPIPIPGELETDAFETLRLEIEKRMRETQAEEDLNNWKTSSRKKRGAVPNFPFSAGEDAGSKKCLEREGG
ncbi:MAG: hypothetical protein KJ663_04515, partial [Proteobacteria bacterium]|nr:hypothetical protein [Pseudomonadota bacterium]